MSRGFMSVIYPRADGGFVGASRAVWMECTWRSLASLRACHPGERIFLLDLGALTQDERTGLVTSLGIEVGQAWGPSFTHDTWNKPLAAMVSPFRETIFVDLDFFVVGDLLSALDETTEGLGVLHYPNYTRSWTKICCGLTVIRDHKALNQWLAARNPNRRFDDDEYGLDRLLSGNEIRVSRLSALYGHDREALWGDGPGRGSFCDYGRREITWEPKPVFRDVRGCGCGDVVRAYHLSSARARMATDPTIARFLEYYDLTNRNTRVQPVPHGSQDPKEEARRG